MRPRKSWILTLVGLATATGLLAQAPASTLSERMREAKISYEQPLQQATEELQATRERITQERVPLVEANRELQQRILRLETELRLLRHEATHAEQLRRQLTQESEELRRNLGYVRSTAQERMQDLTAHQLPGEAALHGAALSELQHRLDASAGTPDVTAATQALERVWEHLEEQLGGYVAPGRAAALHTNTLVTGQFLWAGPEGYFRSDDGKLLGVARSRDGGEAVIHPVPAWSAESAAALFRGELGTVPFDGSGGQALRLEMARGTWRDHIKKGGVIGYVILALGGVAVLIIGWKLLDLRQLSVEAPPQVRPVLAAVREQRLDDARATARSLRPHTRELFSTALDLSHRTKTAIEEQLYALLLRWRLHHERRLPLLAVIITASPLLGLLGTVTGMVKTFTLITVFGTGNADKLASGISEALVTTELGLAIAIPTLIVHGYLSQQVKRRLSLLERYAVEFVAAHEAREPTATIVSV